jgi:hypothetical protein
MTRIGSFLRFALVSGVLLCLVPAAGYAQGKGHDKHHDDKVKGKPGEYVVATDRAIVVTRDVLVRHGYRVVRVEETGDTRIVWYRAGNNGRGKGQGRLEKLVIRREHDHVVFVDTPPVFLADIDIRLRL